MLNLKFLYSVIVFYSILYSIQSFEYPKNFEITTTEKLTQPRSEFIDDLDLIKKRIFENSENSMVVFYADWCPHCKDFIPLFDTASQYTLTQNFNFFKVNCVHKSICNEFNVKRYPTLKVFIHGKELEEEPGRDLNSILEYLDKLSSPSLIPIDSFNEIVPFRKLYGENSFLLAYDNKESEFYKCVENLAENNYKTLFYIGAIDIKNYLNFSENIKTPSLIFNEKFSIFQKWENKCEEIKNFIELNKYPIIRKLDSFFIKRLQKEEKTVIIVAVSEKNSIQMNFIENIFSNVSVKNRNLVFAYIDVEKDAYLVNYFKINMNELPKIIIYNFAEKKYYVDNSERNEKVYESEENLNKHLEDLINKLNNNTLAWSTGNWLEDILLKFGFKFDQKMMTYILGGLFGFIVLILVIVVFYCGEKNEEDERQFLNEQVKKNEEQNNNGKDITDKKND